MGKPFKSNRAPKRWFRAGYRRTLPSSGFFRGSACKPSKKKGTVLLMALIVMSSVVVSSLGLGSLILSSLQQTKAIDNAIVAYYAAETGAEQALFDARRSDALPDDVDDAETLTNGATWTRTVANTESIVYAGTILEDGLTEIVLYDPDTQIPADAATVQVTWTDQCDGCTVLNLSLVGWQPGTVWIPTDEANVNFAQYKYPGTPTGGTALLSVPPSAKLYRLRLSPKRGAIDNVQVRAYDEGNAPVPLPGRLRIDSRGNWGGVQQKLLVTVPRQTPLSGIYDFVIFSECSIVKGGSISCPP